MYFFVPYNISPIQQAIQAGHAALEYAWKFFEKNDYKAFMQDKTWIILNGGTTNKNWTTEFGISPQRVGTLNAIADNIGMTIAGSVGDAQTLVRWMQAEIKLYELRHEKRITVEAAATLLANILGQYKYYPFWVQLLVGGVDEKAKLYSIDMLGGITEEKMTSTGSGSPFAFGLLEELFKADQSVESNLAVAAKAVSSAMKRDAASGERVDLVSITKEDGFVRLPKEAVMKLLA